MLKGLSDGSTDGHASSSNSTPYSKLYDLTAAVLRPGVINYDLNLTILLKGARGIGKFTAISNVAQDLGIHMLEVRRHLIINLWGSSSTS